MEKAQIMDHSATPNLKSWLPDLTGKAIGTFSRGIASNKAWLRFLGADRYVSSPRANDTIAAVVGWGHKPNTEEARRYAKRRDLPYIRLEDGYLRSPGGANDPFPPVSLIADDLGVHHDPSQTTRLETILKDHPLDDGELLARADQCIERLISHQIGKYNPRASRSAKPPAARHVLVLGQVPNDDSLRLGAPNHKDSDLVRLAEAENPGALVVYRPHPAVLSGAKEPPPDFGAVGRVATVDLEGVQFATALQAAECVYTATSLGGFEALMLGAKVRLTGAPWYAGWGLCEEQGVPETGRRGRELTLRQAFAAAWILYPLYRDPYTGETCTLEDAIDAIGAAKRQRSASSGRPVFMRGISMWKRKRMAAFIAAPDLPDAQTVSTDDEAIDAATKTGGCILTWATKASPFLLGRAVTQSHVASVLVAEDGFLRSNGLGAGLVEPCSITIDSQRPHYDPSGPSDLEVILAKTRFSNWDRHRARELMTFIRHSGIHKYGAGSSKPDSTRPRTGNNILVLGQVPDDASVAYASRSVRSMASLLIQVRAMRPDAPIYYREHPDVSAKLRFGGVTSDLLKQLRIERSPEGKTLREALEEVREVHCISSLGGLEAMIYGVGCVTHGWPAYAGWGLTQDACPEPPPGLRERRARRLSMAELIAGMYLLYPYYLDPATQLPCPAITVAKRIAAGQAAKTAPGGLLWRTLRRFAR